MMYKLRQFITSSLYGRNGVDSLNRFLLILLAVLAAANLLFRFSTIYIFQWVLLILIVFRMYSKNLYKRRKENSKFLSVKFSFLNWFNLQKQKNINRKTHVYKKCPHCKANIKLPRKKGSHLVDCPKCKKEFSVKI